jgi:hypothetical protein
VNFHRSTFQSPPFISIDQTRDILEPTVPDTVLQVQPKLGLLVPFSNPSLGTKKM